MLIVGAGAAGLAATHDLSEAGLHTITIEARNRIGGRIFTHSAPQLELGAEFIHGRPPELLEIVGLAKLSIEQTTRRHWFFENGVLVKTGDFWDKVERVMDQVDDSAADCSFKEYLESLPDDETLRQAKSVAALYVEGFHAASLDRIGIKGLVKANEAAERIHGETSFRLLSGYESVCSWLQEQAERNGATFHLNTTVTELRWRQGQVEAICKADDAAVKFTARAVVITVPLTLLQTAQRRPESLVFTPALPTEVQRAIDTLEMGDAVRIVLRFHERFWEKLRLPGMTEHDNLSDLGFLHYAGVIFPTWWTTLPESESLLVGWVGGPGAAALTNESEESVLRKAVASLARIFQLSEAEICAQVKDWFIHNWHKDPLTVGAYCYVPPNGLEAQMSLAQPVAKTLFFAGEALAVGHIGTVHGALSSGKRAAQRILANL